MSDAALPTLSRSLAPAPKRTKSPSVTGKVRDALNAMVWDALPRKEAAAKAGISEHGLYKALRSPHVKAFYLAELEVLRTSERARNLHRLAEIRDKADNMPAVQSIRLLEQLGDETQARSAGSVSLPGLTIQIVNHVAPQQSGAAAKVIDASDE